MGKYIKKEFLYSTHSTQINPGNINIQLSLALGVYCQPKTYGAVLLDTKVAQSWLT